LYIILSNSQDIRNVGDFIFNTIILNFFIIISTTTLAAFPFTSGLITKELNIDCAYIKDSIEDEIIYRTTIICSFITAAYTSKTFAIINYQTFEHARIDKLHITEFIWYDILSLIFLSYNSILFSRLQNEDFNFYQIDQYDSNSWDIDVDEQNIPGISSYFEEYLLPSLLIFSYCIFIIYTSFKLEIELFKFVYSSYLEIFFNINAQLIDDSYENLNFLSYFNHYTEEDTTTIEILGPGFKYFIEFIRDIVYSFETNSLRFWYTFISLYFFFYTYFIILFF